jgi:hypothetical protein
LNKQKDDISDSDRIERFDKITVMQSLDQTLQLIGESPFKKKKLGKVKYPASKMKRIESAVKTKILNFPENINSNAVSSSPTTGFFKTLEGKFSRFNNFMNFESDNLGIPIVVVIVVVQSNVMRLCL